MPDTARLGEASVRTTERQPPRRGDGIHRRTMSQGGLTIPHGRRSQSPDAAWMSLAHHANLAMRVWVALIGGYHLAGGHTAARRNAHEWLADASELGLRGRGVM
jgi:hypothetical protein